MTQRRFGLSHNCLVYCHPMLKLAKQPSIVHRIGLRQPLSTTSRPRPRPEYIRARRFNKISPSTFPYPYPDQYSYSYSHSHSSDVPISIDINMGGGSVPTIPVPWDRLRAWINDQEALEKQQGRTTLTRSQIQMLSVFVNFLDDEPQFEAGEDYVSRLMLRTKDIESPTFEDLNPVEVPINGSFFQRWQTVCYLNHVSPTPKKFPALGYGIEDEKKGIPMFKSKKLAKQYAAKYAYSYLRGEPPSIPSAQSSAQSGLAEGGASLTPTFTPTTNARGILSAPPTLLGPASGKASPSPASRDAATSDGNKPVSNTPGLLVKSMGCLEIAEKSNNDFSNEDSSAIVGRVAALSGRLGLESPTYHVEEEVNNPGFFSGQPIFKDSLYPPDLGIVAGVMGKKNAKTAIARALLVWLEGEKRRRDGMINEVLGGLDQEAKTETERQSDTI